MVNKPALSGVYVRGLGVLVDQSWCNDRQWLFRFSTGFLLQESHVALEHFYLQVSDLQVGVGWWKVPKGGSQAKVNGETVGWGLCGLGH